MSLLLCGNAFAFEGNVNVAGGTADANTGAKDKGTSYDSSPANRASKPGEYIGYSDAIYDETYELASRYVQVSDGTGLAMDPYRPKDKATGKVIDTKPPVLWMHTPYNRRYANYKREVRAVFPPVHTVCPHIQEIVSSFESRISHRGYYEKGQHSTRDSRPAEPVLRDQHSCRHDPGAGQLSSGAWFHR